MCGWQCFGWSSSDFRFTVRNSRRRDLCHPFLAVWGSPLPLQKKYRGFELGSACSKFVTTGGSGHKLALSSCGGKVADGHPQAAAVQGLRHPEWTDLTSASEEPMRADGMPDVENHGLPSSRRTRRLRQQSSRIQWAC